MRQGLDLVDSEEHDAVHKVRPAAVKLADPLHLAGAELLVGPGARDVDVDAAIGALAAQEAVAEHARLVAGDLEVERRHVPLGGLAGIRRLQVDMVDAVAHGHLLVGCRPR